jgi:hypothetical protein
MTFTALKLPNLWGGDSRVSERSEAETGDALGRIELGARLILATPEHAPACRLERLRRSPRE